jgi:hypothetical protein
VTTPKPVPDLPKLPLVMLGLMSVVTFGGPLAILFVVRGGERPDWPPDRAIEWWTFWLTIVLAIGFMAACVTTPLWSRRGRG